MMNSVSFPSVSDILKRSHVLDAAAADAPLNKNNCREHYLRL